MRTRQLAAVVAALMGLVLFPVAAFAQRKPPVRGGQPARQKSPTAGPREGAETQDAVERVLRKELVEVVDRRAALAPLMAKQPQAQLPRWQAGFVKEQGNWVSFDASRSANPLDPRLAAYRKRRAEAESTFAAQYELANWCKQQKLPDQERVHLLAALNLASDPQKDPLLPRLGYKRFGGMWLSREQMVQIQKECDSAQSSMTQWATKLEKIARDLKGKPLVALAASAELRQMDDPEVIPAMEQVFAARSEEGAEIAIGVFDRISAPEATEALTRQAVFSPWEKARDRGALALKNRKFEDFVPDLLALLAIPRGTSFQIAETTAMNRTGTGWLAVGRLDYRYTIAVETGDEIQVASLGVFNYVTTDALTRRYMGIGSPSSFDSRTTYRLSEEFNVGRLNAGRLEALRVLDDQTQQLESKVSDLYDRMERMNRRVAAILKTVSGENHGTDPRNWWTWWQVHADVQLAAPKRVTIVQEQQTIGDARPIYLSCFAAGTPVQTETGLMAIETIRPGDRVLSQDVETGELAYKPVLHTTVRPERKLSRLQVGDEIFTVTLGHRFWTPGRGWTKTVDLEPQMQLRTATSSLPVISQKEGPTERTYNLVVADFHTYFVGDAAILTHDVEIPTRSDRVVPGLDRRRVAVNRTP